MHNTSSTSCQSICLIKVNIKNNNDNSNCNNKWDQVHKSISKLRYKLNKYIEKIIVTTAKLTSAS